MNTRVCPKCGLQAETVERLDRYGASEYRGRCAEGHEWHFNAPPRDERMER